MHATLRRLLGVGVPAVCDFSTAGKAAVATEARLAVRMKARRETGGFMSGGWGARNRPVRPAIREGPARPMKVTAANQKPGFKAHLLSRKYASNPANPGAAPDASAATPGGACLVAL